MCRGLLERWIKPGKIAINRRKIGQACHIHDNGEPVDPVVLSLGDEEAQELLYFLVLALNFAVAFRVVGGGQAGLNTKALVESTHVASGKLVTTIGEDLAQETVETEDISVVDIGHAFSGDCRVNGHEMALVRVVIHVNSDRVFSSLRVARELSDGIDSDMFPEAGRYFL